VLRHTLSPVACLLVMILWLSMPCYSVAIARCVLSGFLAFPAVLCHAWHSLLLWPAGFLCVSGFRGFAMFLQHCAVSSWFSPGHVGFCGAPFLAGVWFSCTLAALCGSSLPGGCPWRLSFATGSLAVFLRSCSGLQAVNSSLALCSRGHSFRPVRWSQGLCGISSGLSCVVSVLYSFCSGVWLV
jgi:hypothetical protein